MPKIIDMTNPENSAIILECISDSMRKAGMDIPMEAELAMRTGALAIRYLIDNGLIEIFTSHAKDAS